MPGSPSVDTQGLARLLGCNEALVRRWAAGSGAVPEPVAAWLDRLVRYHVAHPPPAEWKRPGQRRAAYPSRPITERNAG